MSLELQNIMKTGTAQSMWRPAVGLAAEVSEFESR
jgi:hypothetical protein